MTMVSFVPLFACKVRFGWDGLRMLPVWAPWDGAHLVCVGAERCEVRPIETHDFTHEHAPGGADFTPPPEVRSVVFIDSRAAYLISTSAFDFANAVDARSIH